MQEVWQSTYFIVWGGGEGVWKLNKICFGIKHTPVQSYEINPYSSEVKNGGIIPQSDEANRFEIILHHSGANRCRFLKLWWRYSRHHEESVTNSLKPSWPPWQRPASSRTDRRDHNGESLSLYHRCNTVPEDTGTVDCLWVINETSQDLPWRDVPTAKREALGKNI